MTVGVWLVGARGNVATTAMVGAKAIDRGVVDTTGLVTAREPCARLDLPAIEELVFGGHDIRTQTLRERARALSKDGGPPASVVDVVADDLDRINDRIRTGTAVNCGRALELAGDDLLEDDHSLRGVVEQIQADLTDFERSHDLDRVVVVNVASSEPMPAAPDRYDTRAAFEAALEDDDDIPASSLYAYAALSDGRPFVNFTPNTGSALGGLEEIAETEGVPHMGRDGKTGETLLKSALAPMFAGRNLHVMSWEGHNILGNDDGLVLEDEENQAGKLASKGGVLTSLLPDLEHNRVRIDYTPSLGDWKTAWDHVHFRGFLDTEMKLQFTWEGSDSALAAPLVLDLARLAAYADERDEGGLQPHLASFFKSPMGVDEHDLSQQFAMLEAYVEAHAGEGSVSSADRDQTTAVGTGVAGSRPEVEE
ncbi:inositol-3-phosphate synthase [Natronomonas sp.]|uniref:inositol-3-phosphate synthase n=1 Tax=Natronomonas sp. TaxID=2184060 RepID=UPI003976F861